MLASLVVHEILTFVTEQPSDTKLINFVDGIVLALLRRRKRCRGSPIRIDHTRDTSRKNTRSDLGLR